MQCLGCGERRLHFAFAGPVCQVQEPLYRQWQCPVHIQLLRHIAGPQTGWPMHMPFIRIQDAQCHLGCRRLAGPVGPDQCHNFARCNTHGNATHQPSVRPEDTRVFQCNEHVFFSGQRTLARHPYHAASQLSLSLSAHFFVFLFPKTIETCIGV